jgi:hypothetical protein
MNTRQRGVAALTSISASVLCFVLLILTIAPFYMLFSLLIGFWPIIAGTSLFAGVGRLFLRRESLAVSAVCGALIAACGFYITLFIAVSGI